MNKPFYFDIKGIKEIQDRFSRASDTMKKEIDAELRDGAQVIARNAQRDAPKNYGRLANSISVSKEQPLQYDVVSPVEYAAYMEWGTKKQAKVPAKYAAYAAQFKGLKTGSAEEALYAIKQWVQRTGRRVESAAVYKSGKKKGRNKMLTVEESAYYIFHIIMIFGLKPRPYFFKNYETQEPIIIKNVEQVLGNI